MKQFHLKTPRGRHMTKSIARGHKKGLVDQCFGDEETHTYIRKKTESIIRKEVKKMCSADVNSILQHRHVEDLVSFKWDTLLAELKSHAPTLLTTLTAAIGKHSENSAIVGVCCAVILKSRYRRMSLVQKLVAVILQAGHCSKQVKVFVYYMYYV